jgi:hypothetical protein
MVGEPEAVSENEQLALTLAARRHEEERRQPPG